MLFAKQIYFVSKEHIEKRSIFKTFGDVKDQSKLVIWAEKPKKI